MFQRRVLRIAAKCTADCPVCGGSRYSNIAGSESFRMRGEFPLSVSKESAQDCREMYRRLSSQRRLALLEYCGERAPPNEGRVSFELVASFENWAKSVMIGV